MHVVVDGHEMSDKTPSAGLLCKLHRPPFQRNTTSVSAPGVSFRPIAVQAPAELHETALSAPSLKSLFGFQMALCSTVHIEPSQRSVSPKSLVSPPSHPAKWKERAPPAEHEAFGV